MTFTYTDKEMNKIRTIERFINKTLSLDDAKSALNCSERTIFRYQATLKDEWPPWFIHGLKGKPSNHNPNTSKYASIDQIISKPKFSWFWPTLLAEKLEEDYGIVINKESLRQRMIKQWLRVVEKRKIIVARQKRERRPWYAMLIQFDGCYHSWLEDGKIKCLLCAVDDATGKIVYARFVDKESLKDIFGFWKEYMRRFGKPKAIYLDCHATYKVNHPEDQFTKEMKTRFQRAMEGLWIAIIYSKEPEGKWRVERWFRTHQDRLVKEMRYFDIKSYEEANNFLEEYYIPKHNEKFSIKAKEEGDFHTELTDEEFIELERRFAKVNTRKLRRDGTVTYMNTTYQILKNQLLQNGYVLTIKESIYGHVKIFTGDKELDFKKLPSR